MAIGAAVGYTILAMRVTALLRRLISLDHIRVTGAEFGDEGIVIDVAPTWRDCRCSGCGQTCPRYDQRERRWRHLDLGGMRCDLRYSLRRAKCPQCGVRVEQVPWAECDSGFTKPFEEFVALMAQRTDKTTVTGLLRIAWYTVGRIVERVTRRLGGDPSARLHGLRRIGIDELSYEKHHKYVTVVTDHDRGCTVWVTPGRDAAALDAFFDALGLDGVAALEVVSIDMSGAFKKALRERAPHVEVVFDRFHVQRLIHEALDEVRRGLVNQASKLEEKKALKKTRFTLQRAPWKLDAIARRKLAELEADNHPLFQAYLMKESLVAILDAATPDDIHDLLMDWLRWIDLEGSPPFLKAANTIAEHFDGICAYIHTGQTNARAEGINRKIRVVTSRAYGFKSVGNLMAMIMLCCGGLHIPWPHVLPL
jgi:transposase